MLTTSRSVATRIAEVGGGDRGFLWRLNSYWAYRQVPDGVVVELESVSLSRSVPGVLKPVAGPIISRIARESMVRTLVALREHVQTLGSGLRAPRPRAPGASGESAPRLQLGLGAAGAWSRSRTPAASRPTRSAAARPPDPGVSPWTQIVSARIGMSTPSRVVTTPSSSIRRIRAPRRRRDRVISAPGVPRATSEPSAL